MSEKLKRYFKEHNGREMNAAERAAAERIKEFAAPLGLSEWQTSDGAMYYASRNALAAQIGINRREAER